MIWIYTQGSSRLGLGHLSRIVPLYHELISKGFSSTVVLTGDDLGEAYLKSFSIDNIVLAQKVRAKNFTNPEDTVWIIDATKIFQEEILSIIQNARTTILISPKFDSGQIDLIHAAFIRSDPFQLSLENKFANPKYLIYNKQKAVNYNGISLGIALSGSSTNQKLNELVAKLINHKKISPSLNTLHVFLGASSAVSIDRKETFSYQPRIFLYSTLDSLWNYVNKVDLMIVGNGIIVDECIAEEKAFLVYAYNEDNLIIKSGNSEFVSKKMCFDINSLLTNIENFIFSVSCSKERELTPHIKEPISSSKLCQAIEEWIHYRNQRDNIHK